VAAIGAKEDAILQGSTAPRCPHSLLTVEGVDPFGFYEELRSHGDILWDDGMRAWIVLDYETCKLIESDEARFPNAYSKPNPVHDEIKGGRTNITIMQGSEHRSIRHFHMRFLSPSAVRDYQVEFVAPILDFLIGRILEKGRADLAADLASQLPPMLTVALFNMPWQDEDLVREVLDLNQAIMAWTGMRGTGDPEFERKAKAASARLNALLLPYIARSRATPGQDLISRVLADGPEHYRALSDEEVLPICRELLLAGSDTTIHGIANTLYLILTEPQVRAALDHDLDGALPATIEEALRIYGSVHFQSRYAREDCVVGGVAIRKDDAIILQHAAANRDPETYDCPHEIDLNRSPASKHLAFGIGPRLCPGAGLARTEMRDAVKAVLTRLPKVRLDASAEPPRFEGLFVRSWRPINVLFN
jgi:cytochrome P450